MDSGKEDLCLLPTLQVSVLVMCHTRELAFQISKEYERFSKYMPSVKVSLLRFCVGYHVAFWSHAGLKQHSSILRFVVTYVPYKPDELCPAPQACAGPTYLSLAPALQSPLGSEGVGLECQVPSGWIETAFFLSP